MNVKQLNPVGGSNVYVVENDGKAVIIDAGMDAAPVFEYLDQNGIIPECLLLTHGHYDHCFAAHSFAGRGVKIYLAAADVELIKSGRHILPQLLPSFKNFSSQPLEDSQTLSLIGLEFKAIATPGHTEGGFCFTVCDYLFTGDTLFFETVGRTDLPGGDNGKLKASIERLFALEQDYKVLPGHGKPSTLNHEKQHNKIAKNL